MEDTKTDRICALNDAFRKSGAGGIIVMTQSVRDQPTGVIGKITEAVKTHNDFSKDNDPYGEHDFGSFIVGDLKLFWKIDYYNLDLNGGSPDPADPNVTTRVLTIMLREEY